MADQEGEFSFFQGIHVRIDISISIKTMTNKFGKQVDLQDLIQMRLRSGDIITPRSRDKLKTLYLHHQSGCGHQTQQDGNLP